MNESHQLTHQIQEPGYPGFQKPVQAAGVVNWHLTILPTQWRPPTDVFEKEDSYVVRVEIPGMRDGDFSVTVEKNLLSIHGSRQDTSERRSFHQMEIRFGEFSTEVELPVNVDVNQIKAEYDDGFLWVILPKAAPHKVTLRD